MPYFETTSHPLLLGLRQSGLIASGDRLLAAVSGGPDSTALLLALVEQGHAVVAAHYDHALQPGSDRVAEHVRTMCGRLGVEVLIERRETPLPRGSVQAGARSFICCVAAAWPGCAACPRVAACSSGRCSRSGGARSSTTWTGAASSRFRTPRTPTPPTRAFGCGAKSCLRWSATGLESPAVFSVPPTGPPPFMSRSRVRRRAPSTTAPPLAPPSLLRRSPSRPR